MNCRFSEKQAPLISIVTPSFNQAGFIREALRSVQHQNRTDYEHLVIDGLSTDGTVDLLRTLTIDNKQTAMSWIAEHDSGQSEALNKGFKRATGEIIGWLNSDDRYMPGCFDQVVKAFEENPDVDIVYGDYRLVDESGNLLQVRREIEFSAFVLLYHRILYIPTTAAFFRRRIFDEGNWLDEHLHYAMDLDFFLRLNARGYRFKHIPEALADFRLHPDSKTCSLPDRQRLEHEQVLFAVAPIFRHVKSYWLRKLVLLPLRQVAGAKRYLEKLRKGYYRDRLWSNAVRSPFRQKL